MDQQADAGVDDGEPCRAEQFHLDTRSPSPLLPTYLHQAPVLSMDVVTVPCAFAPYAWSAFLAGLRADRPALTRRGTPAIEPGRQVRLPPLPRLPGTQRSQGR